MAGSVEHAGAVTARTVAAWPSVSIVLPCLNEVESVGACVREGREALEAAGITGEVIVVDNGSTDGSPESAAAAGARVVEESNRGYGSALRAGFNVAEGEVIVMADADATYPLNKIDQLVAPIAAGEADFVLGGRLDDARNDTMPWLHRHVGTPVLTRLVARACGRRVVGDSQSGFRAFRTADLSTLALSSSGMELASEMLIRASRAGLRITEVRTGYRVRVGESKLSTFRDGMRHLRLILLLAPDLLLVAPGAALFSLGVVSTILGLLNQSGVQVGSLRWQPVFISSIGLVLGMQMLLAGALVSSRSSLASPRAQQMFAFASRAEFPIRCAVVGLAFGAIGAVIDLVLFIRWVNGTPALVSGASYASLGQALVIIGSTLVMVGIISQIQRATDARLRTAASDAAKRTRRLQV